MAVGVDRPGHPHVAVGVGRPEDGAEVVVADGEGVGQRELERDVVARVVAHGEWTGGVAVRRDVRPQPAIHVAVGPRGVLHLPGVAQRRDGLGRRVRGVEVVREQEAVGVVGIGLGEDRLPGGEPHRPRVTEAPHARERAEVVVEAAVLLHQQDDVLDLAQVEAGRVGSGDGLADARGQIGGERRPGRGAGPSLQELAPRERGGEEGRFIRHGVSVLFVRVRTVGSRSGPLSGGASSMPTRCARPARPPSWSRA